MQLTTHLRRHHLSKKVRGHRCRICGTYRNQRDTRVERSFWNVVRIVVLGPLVEHAQNTSPLLPTFSPSGSVGPLLGPVRVHVAVPHRGLAEAHDPLVAHGADSDDGPSQTR